MKDLVLVNDLIGIKIIDVKQFEDLKKDIPDFQNKYLKLAYFLGKEGITNTIRKLKAYKDKKPRYLTFLVIESSGIKYFNVSIQTASEPGEFVIKNEFYKYPEIDFKIMERSTEHYLKHFNQYEDSTDYSILNIDAASRIVLEVNHKQISKNNESGLFIYGLGGYVKMYIIHHFKNLRKIACIDYKSPVSKDFKKEYRFEYAFTLPEHSFSLLENTTHPVAIIATYHSDHARLASQIFKLNPDAYIFIEKPPVVTLDDLDLLIDLYNKKANIEIGFNRRFTTFSQYVKKKVQGKIVMITCSVKEVLINDNHWYLWSNQGTRITGNAVHWFDLANMWIDSNPVEINMISNPHDQESSAISVLYKNGSILNLTVSDKGNSLRGVQEKIEIRFDNESIFIDDFISMSHIKNNGKKLIKYNWFRDKGHNAMYRNFNNIIQKKTTSEYTVTDLIRTSVITYFASQMLTNNLRNMHIEGEITNYLSQIDSKANSRISILSP